jgi:ATP-dependent helicase/nuclease subunit B
MVRLAVAPYLIRGHHERDAVEVLHVVSLSSHPYNAIVTPHPPLISNDLLSLPAAKSIVLSPSDRARRAFARAWAHDAQRASGRDAAPLPRFMTIKSWFATLWNEGQLFGLLDDTRTLVAPTIEAAIWRHIASSVTAATRGESAVLADRFAEAWMLEHGYRGDAAFAPLASGSNGELYRVARKAFVDALRDANAITTSELPHALFANADCLRDLTFPHITTTPQFSGLISENNTLSILNRNAVFTNFHGAKNDSAISKSRFPARDGGDERAAAISWVTQFVERESLENRHRQIAIVVPDLQQTRGGWKRALREAGLPHNISLGLPVSKYPWAAAGFALVSALFSPSAPETIAQALRHPRWGRSDATVAAINRREIELLRRGVPEITLNEFCDGASDGLRALGARIANALPSATLKRGNASRAHWSGVFEQAISAFDDAPTSLDSQTFQLREALLASIETWKQLDDWLPQVSIAAAQQELIAMTDQAAFQPEGSDAPVQVIGLLESAGVPFEAMWVTGMSERVLPEAVRANPYLAIQWQREQHVGLASVDECDARATRLLEGWKLLSPKIVASLPAQIDDEPQVWSPLVASWPDKPLVAMPVPSSQIRNEEAALETIDDESAPPWQPAGSRGVRALEAQANCPRRGFAEGRLRLVAWPERSDGLSPQLRGELVHDVAERVGRALIAEAMDFARVQDLLSTHVADAVTSVAQANRRIPQHVWQAEQTRLQAVFTKLLQVESARAPFSIQDVEHVAKTRLENIDFSLRIDRVDRVNGIDSETGEVRQSRLAVIDFKSGNVDRKFLFDERLTAPQLPLYALALGIENVDAVAYARVSDDYQDFVSFGTPASGLEANKRGNATSPTWDELRDLWRTKLTRLATELIAGDAALAPAYGETTCKRCDYQRFCRVDLQLLSSIEHESDKDDA